MKDFKRISESEYDRLFEGSEKVAKQLGGFMKKLRNTKES
jgi:hypothetical protein